MKERFKLELISLKQFLMLYNFRYSNDGARDDLDSTIVRIHLDEYKENWVEFGMYDYDEIDSKEKRLNSTLNEKLLKKYVYSFDYDNDNKVLSVFVQHDRIF